MNSTTSLSFLTLSHSKENEPLGSLDRFIPRRDSMDLATFNINIIKDAKEKIKKTPKESAYSSMLKENMAPSNQTRKNSLIINPDMPKKNGFYVPQSIQKKRGKTKPIPDRPFKILEAPELTDDFYSNILDWSCQNQLAVCLNNIIYLMDMQTYNNTKLYHAYDCESITSIKFNKEGDKLIFGNIIGQLSVWDLNKQKEINSFTTHNDRIAALDWKDVVISGSRDHQIIASDFRLENPSIAVFKSHLSEVCQLKYSSFDNKTFASGGNDNKVLVWSLHNTIPIMSERHSSCIKALAWSKTQHNMLYSGGGIQDGIIKKWNVNTKELVHQKETNSQICSLLTSQWSNNIISTHGYPYNEISIWHGNSLKNLDSLTSHTERILHTCFSHDDRVLVTGSCDDTLQFWQIHKDNTKHHKSNNPFQTNSVLSLR